MSSTADRLVDEVAANEEARHRLARMIADDLAQRDASSRWRRLRPFLAGLSSGAVLVLAFLLPSLQEQWDLHKTRSAIDRYAEVGRDLMRHEQYTAAEQAFGRALELSGNQRLDLLEGQLKAKVMRIYDTPEWRANPDEDIAEADFIYLLEIETAAEHPHERASTLGAYGAYLAGQKRLSDAESNLKEAIRLDATAAAPHIHLGNVYDDEDKSADAEAEYRRAIVLNPREANARYNLGLLLAATSRPALAETELRQSVALQPEDTTARLALIEVLEALGKNSDALQQAQAAAKLDPDNAQITDIIKRLTSAHSGSGASANNSSLRTYESILRPITFS
jgi:Tfp pilus assembly protein PilF